jgi:hypothetical protein
MSGLNYTYILVVPLGNAITHRFFFQFFRLNYLVSGLTCQEQEAPGQGQLYGRNSQISSCSAFSFSPNDILQPVDLCLHGNIRLFATFSIAKFRMLPVRNDKTYMRISI